MVVLDSFFFSDFIDQWDIKDERQVVYVVRELVPFAFLDVIVATNLLHKGVSLQINELGVKFLYSSFAEEPKQETRIERFEVDLLAGSVVVYVHGRKDFSVDEQNIKRTVFINVATYV